MARRVRRRSGRKRAFHVTVALLGSVLMGDVATATAPTRTSGTGSAKAGSRRASPLSAGVVQASSAPRRSHSVPPGTRRLAGTGSPSTPPSERGTRLGSGALPHAADTTPRHVNWQWSIDVGGIFTSSTIACQQLLGYDPCEIIGQPVSVVMDPNELVRATAMVNALGMTDGGLSRLVIAGRHRNRTSVWFEVDIHPRYDTGGTLVEVDGNSRAIGLESDSYLASRRTIDRVQAMLDSRLLMTAFQPIVDLSSGRVLGAEALTRSFAASGDTPDVWFSDAASVGLGTELELLAVQTARSRRRRFPTTSTCPSTRRRRPAWTRTARSDHRIGAGARPARPRDHRAQQGRGLRHADHGVDRTQAARGTGRHRRRRRRLRIVHAHPAAQPGSRSNSIRRSSPTSTPIPPGTPWPRRWSVSPRISAQR